MKDLYFWPVVALLFVAGMVFAALCYFASDETQDAIAREWGW